MRFVDLAGEIIRVANLGVLGVDVHHEKFLFCDAEKAVCVCGVREQLLPPISPGEIFYDVCDFVHLLDLCLRLHGLAYCDEVGFVHLELVVGNCGDTDLVGHKCHSCNSFRRALK